LLFEYFAFFLIREILGRFGFVSEVAAEKPEADSRLVFRHHSGESLVLSYDRLVNDLSQARQEGREQMVSLIGGSRRPDLLLERFSRDGEFQKAMILEVKYRRLQKFYREDLETDVMRQLAVFNSFKYFRPGRRLNPGADIETIGILYPARPHSEAFTEEILGYEFLPIRPLGFQLSEPTFQPLIATLNRFLQ
jgi:hypothetical protein